MRTDRSRRARAGHVGDEAMCPDSPALTHLEANDATFPAISPYVYL